MPQDSMWRGILKTFWFFGELNNMHDQAPRLTYFRSVPHPCKPPCHQPFSNYSGLDSWSYIRVSLSRSACARLTIILVSSQRHACTCACLTIHISSSPLVQTLSFKNNNDASNDVNKEINNRACILVYRNDVTKAKPVHLRPCLISHPKIFPHSIEYFDTCMEH
jgi:hypothetical protein